MSSIQELSIKPPEVLAIKRKGSISVGQVLEVLYDDGVRAVAARWPELPSRILAQLQGLLTERNSASALLNAADEVQSRLDQREREVAELITSVTAN